MNLAHYAHRLSCQNELPLIDIDALHPGKHHMIVVSDIQDQELSIGSEWSRIEHPAVGRGGYIGARLDLDSVALRPASKTVIVAKCGNCATGGGLGKLAGQIGKGIGGCDPGAGKRLVFSTFTALFQPALGFHTGSFSSLAGRLDFLFDRGDQLLQRGCLFGQLRGTGPLCGQVFFRAVFQRLFLLK